MIVCYCANTCSTLVTPAQIDNIPGWWIKIKIWIDIYRGIWLRFPRFDHAPCNLRKGSWIIEYKFSIIMSWPPPSKRNTASGILITASFKIFGRADAAIRQAAGGEVDHTCIHAGQIWILRVNVTGGGWNQSKLLTIVRDSDHAWLNFTSQDSDGEAGDGLEGHVYLIFIALLVIVLIAIAVIVYYWSRKRKKHE